MGSASNEEREVRGARNQALFRAVNEKMLELNETFGEIVGTFAIACECSRIDCVELLEIPAEAYRAVRESPRTFAVRSDHVAVDVERVLSNHDGYAVVEALGQGARIAEATFRRRRASSAHRNGRGGRSGMAAAGS
jgi:hypothetical protein